RRAAAEAGHVLVAAALVAPGVVGPRDLVDVGRVEDAMDARLHAAELAGVDEQGLALALAMAVAGFAAGQEPEAHRDLRRVEELPGAGHHAVHEVGLDELAPDLALARLLRR